MFKCILLIFTVLLTACSPLNTEESTETEDAENESTELDLTVRNPNQSEFLRKRQANREKDKVSFVGVGDNLIHEEIFDYAQINEETYNFQPIYENVEDVIQKSDLSFINQETMFGGDDRAFLGYPSFNTPSDMASDLVDVGFNLMSIANNHTLDMGVSGVYNMLDYLSEYEDEIVYTGAFESQEDRDEISLIEKEGLTFSLLAYTYGTNYIEPDTSYRVNYFDQETITQDVERAKEKSDFVIVSAHWGDEHAFSPNAMQEEYAQLFADLGVDVVVGHHSHTIQPIEWVTGETGSETLVIYSLGNFLASTTSDINLLGGLISLDFIQKEDTQYVDNVYFDPLVIHYENEETQNIDTRSDFSIYKLEKYTEELAAEHGVDGYEDNTVSIEEYKALVEEVIDEEFLMGE